MMSNIKQVIRRLRPVGSSKRIRLAYWVLMAIALIGLFSNFIANDVPLLGKKDGKFVLPAAKDLLFDLGIVSWKDRIKYRHDDPSYSFKISTPIPYKSQNIDHNNAGYVSPFGSQNVDGWNRRHWLGTDQLGRDVTAGLVNGCRVSLIVGFFTCLLALLIGIPLGLLSGYYGNRNARISIYGKLLFWLFLILSLYFLNYYRLSWAFWLCIILGGLAIYGIERLVPDAQKRVLHLDSMITKLMEIFKSIPGIILLFVLLGVFAKASIWNIVICLGLLSWYQIARYIRAELMSIREKEFVEAQRSIGQSDWNIIFKHCLQLAMPPVLVSLVFLFASVILTESTLSFLGIGLPVETVSWGTMLSEARKYFPAWWLAFFPGLGILGAILSLHIIAEHWINKRSGIAGN